MGADTKLKPQTVKCILVVGVVRVRRQISEEILTLFVIGGLVVNVVRVRKQISEGTLTLFVTGCGQGSGRERGQGQEADFRRKSDPVRDRLRSGTWS